MFKIQDLKAREILDSRGNPTVEVQIKTNEQEATAIVPSGASTGIYEAVELRDGDEQRYGGKGVEKAVHNVNVEIKHSLLGMNANFQEEIDNLLIALDGTPNKARLGANAILGVSLACARVAAKVEEMPFYEYLTHLYNMKHTHFLLPVPMMNVINGGKHADSGLDIQEFMILPVNAKTFKEALRMGAETFQHLKKILSNRKLTTSVGDEGGFAPNLKSNAEAFEIIIEAIEKAGYQPGKDIYLGIDAAASSFGNEKDGYKIDGKTLSSEELVAYYVNLVDKYPLISIEDGLGEDDWAGFQMLNQKLGQKIQLVGDDIFVTNVERLRQGINIQAANSVLIKLNQIGTVTETVNAVKLALEAGWTAVVSHRSGETEDTSIADFVVAMGTGQIKTGSLCRTDRICKYNQLLRIEEHLGEEGRYVGKEAFKLL